MHPGTRVAAALLVLSAATVSAQTLPTGFYTENAASGALFDVPVVLAFSPDGRMFVGEKAGVVYIVENGVKLSTPFIDISADVLNHHDRGLLGMELDPDFLNNGHIYFLYTFDWNGAGDFQRNDVAGRLVRYTVDAGNPNLADPSTRLVLLGPDFTSGIPACYFSHAPGDIHFGSDGSLLVAAGDGASYNEVDPGGLYPVCFGSGKLDPSQDIGAFRSQWIGSYAGKILRLDPATGNGYPSNPFYTGDPTDVESKVWAYGLRNPYRFGVRPGGSTNPADGAPGSLYIGDVGWNTYEELNVATQGGENFGWPCYEGPNPNGGYQSASPAHHDCATIGTPANPSVQQNGMAWWHHNDGNNSYPQGPEGSTAVGGDFYTGTKYPTEYNGRVFYGDYATGWMRTLDVDGSDNLVAMNDFGTGLGGIVEIRYDPLSQYMHYIDIFSNQVLRIRHIDGDANGAPIVVASVTPQWGYTPLVVTVSASASYDPNGDVIDFFWDFGDGGTSTAADTSYTYTANGNFPLTLTVSDEYGVQTVRQWTVAAGNTPPVPNVIQPDNGVAVDIGTQVLLAALATDAETPEDSLTYHWEVTQVHSDHDHPNFFTSDQKATMFEVVEHGLPHEVNYLRATVSVTDPGGLVGSETRFIVLNRNSEVDITDEGSPIALISSPTGTGNPDIGVIHDGVFPVEGSGDPLTQYDTFDGGGVRALDWIGYSYPGTRYFSRLIFQEGMHSPAGGYFDSLWVEVRSSGVWESPDYVSVIPLYAGDDGVDFGLYTITFEARAGDAIRLVGVPGGSGSYISVGELRVNEIPRAEFSADVTVGPTPLTVNFTDLSNLTNPSTWRWDFGDGSTSTAAAPSHTYTNPGPRTVNLTVTGDEGTYFEEKQDYIFVGTSGLFAEYFDTAALSGNPLTRVDPAVDFDWGTGSPDGAIPADQFSARWSGWVQPRYSETCTFYTTSDDGVRLWIDGVLVIDQWAVQGSPTEYSAGVSLVADRLYDIRMEFYEDTGSAQARLEWASASQAREVIPQSRLYARQCGQGVGDVDGSGTLSPGDALCAFNIYLGGQVPPPACDAPGFDCEVLAADSNCDGLVTPSDALNIYNRYLSALPLQNCFAQSGGAVASAPGYRTHVSLRTLVGKDQGDDVIEMTFSVDDPAHFDAFGVRVRFPGQSIRFVDLERTLHTDGWVGLSARQESGSTVVIGGFDARGISRSGETAIFKLCFAAPGAVGSADIEFIDMVDDLEDASVDPGGGSGGGPGQLPSAMRLYQNHPNPFNPVTSIRFDVPGGAAVRVRLAVYSVDGALVNVLVDEQRPPGYYESRWDGRNRRGETVPSGVYFYVLEAGTQRTSRRMVLLK